MADAIPREERAALIERVQTHLDASEYSRLSHSNAGALLRALVASEAEVERLKAALKSIIIITDGPTPHSPYTIAASVNAKARAACGETIEKMTGAEAGIEKLKDAVNALDHALDRTQYHRTLVPSARAEIDATRRRARAALTGEKK